MKKYVTFLLSFIILFGRFALANAVLAPDLKEKLENADPSETFRVIVLMKDYLNVPALDKSLYESRATLAERHQVVVEALQNEAAATQKEILKYLDVLESQGKVVFYGSLWIVNALYLEGTLEAIYKLSYRNDVRAILIDAPTELIKPVSGAPATELTNNAQPGLKIINAHLLWKEDITGEGAIVMNIDTGVDGTHPALADRWLGNEVPSSQAWLDLIDGTTFPVDPPVGLGGHGTHTMGTMCGLGETTQDTIGVAFGAKWIAARALGLSSIKLQALQWSADPDGNPATQDDVPDVVNCSWSSSESPCDPYYWEAIDNLEAAGAAVIFSAGNNGAQGQMTIDAPMNRATTPVNIWATGAIDGDNSELPIAAFSARGPSKCDDHPIKPEAVAPGVRVVSSYRNGGYEFLSGTSMAAPHVSGAIALLRQAFPEATGIKLKYALLLTAQETPADLAGHDDGEPVGQNSGEDNNYGMGVIDVYAAYQSLKKIDQTREDGSSLTGTPLYYWENNTFEEYNVPDYIIVPPGTPEIVLRGMRDVVENPDEKYNNWNDLDDVTNHHIFTVQPNDREYVSQFKNIVTATIKNELLSGGDSGNDSIQFKDPWLVLEGDPAYYHSPYGYHNLGQDDAIFEPNDSPFNPNINPSGPGSEYK